MRYIICFLALFFVSSCTKQTINPTPLGSFMPRYLDIDSIMPIIIDDTSKIVNSKMQDYVSIPVDSGLLVTPYGKVTLPDGVLLSERKITLYNFYKISWERQQRDLYYTRYLMKTYHDKAIAAEILYQNEILKWRKEAERTWVEKNMGYLGFLAGVITLIGVDFAIYQVAK